MKKRPNCLPRNSNFQRKERRKEKGHFRNWFCPWLFIVNPTISSTTRVSCFSWDDTLSIFKLQRHKHVWVFFPPLLSNKRKTHGLPVELGKFHPLSISFSVSLQKSFLRGYKMCACRINPGESDEAEVSLRFSKLIRPDTSQLIRHSTHHLSAWDFHRGVSSYGIYFFLLKLYGRALYQKL